MARAGVQALDINIELVPLQSSAEYVTLSTSGGCVATYCLPNDCISGSGLGDNTNPSLNDGPWCKLLGVYDQVIKHAVQTDGLKVRLAPAFSNFTKQGNECTIGPPVRNTEAAVEKCYGPLYTAAAQRWGANNLVDSVTVLHEPAGAWNPGQWNGPLWTTVEAETWISAMKSAVATGCGSATCYVGAATSSGKATSNANNYETVYWLDWMQNQGTLGLDFAAVDVYPNSSDPSVQLQPITRMGMCNDISPLNCLVSGGGYALVQYWMTHTFGAVFNQGFRINESNRPQWVPSTCVASGAEGILDNAHSTWLDTGLDPAWQTALTPWAAAQGFKSVSQYATQVWVSYNAQNYSGPAYAENVLANNPNNSVLLPLNIGYTTLSGLAEATSAARLVSLQGAAKSSGNVHLGPPH